MSILSFLFGNKTANANIKVLSPNDFKAAITKNTVQLVDVRTPNEFKSGHIKDAKNIDFFSTSFSKGFENFDKQQAIYIYCRSGGRSASAAKKLSKLGFKEIYDLKGGYLKW